MNKYTESNDYGCTKFNGITDMDSAPVLTDQLNKAGIPYTRTELTMGTLTAEPAYLVHYTGAKSGTPVTVLVIPQAGADSWCENYFHFPGMTAEDARGLNWYAVQTHLWAVWDETIRKNIKHPTPCPSCGKLDINNSDKYTDLRGKTRCAHCHGLRP